MNHTRTWRLKASTLCALWCIAGPAIGSDDAVTWATPEQQLLVASYRAEVDRVRELLQHGVDPNVQFGVVDRNVFPADTRQLRATWTPLLAAVGGHARDAGSRLEFPRVPATDERRVELVKLLLESGANVRLFDDHGADALVLAMHNKHFAVIEPLLRAGSDPNVRIRAILDGPSQHTPLHIAAFDGALSAVEALLEHGADPNLRDSTGATALHCALRRLFFLHLLRDAVTELNDQLELIRVLCRAEANIHQPDKRGRSPLEKAAGLAKSWGRGDDVTAFDRAIEAMVSPYSPADQQRPE